MDSNTRGHSRDRSSWKPGRKVFFAAVFSPAEGRRQLRDEDFSPLYGQHRGRNGAPPFLLAIALLLKTHEMKPAAGGLHCRADVPVPRLRRAGIGLP